MTSLDRRSARRAEIDRDHRLVAATLVAELRRISRPTAAGLDPERLWQQANHAVEASREAFRRLNNARINLRAVQFAQDFDDSTTLPEALAHYRHRGNYRGEFPSMSVLSIALRRSGVTTEAVHSQESMGLAEELHLRGELWTFELADVIHVFTAPQSPSDVALGRRPPPRTSGPGQEGSPPPSI